MRPSCVTVAAIALSIAERAVADDAAVVGSTTRLNARSEFGRKKWTGVKVSFKDVANTDNRASQTGDELEIAADAD